MDDIILTLLYLLYFIPFMASIFTYFTEGKRFLCNLAYMTLIMLIGLSLVTLFNTTEDVFIVNSTTTYNIIGTEFKLTNYNAFFLVSVLFINFIGFINYIKDMLSENAKLINHIKHFFSTYFIYIFATIGILLTDNIFHLFIFLETYSFCIYMITTNYKNENLTILSYKYFSNNIFGSMLGMLSIFYMTIFFNSNSLISIKQQLATISIKDNHEILLIFALFLFSIIIRFFNNSVSRYHNTDYSGANFISISNIFTNTLIGIYLLITIVLYIFPSNALLSVFYIDKIVILAAAIAIIYNSCMLFTSKSKNTIFGIFMRLNLISLAYVVMAIFLKMNIEQTLSFVINYITVNLLIYFFSDYVSVKYGTNEIAVLNKDKILKISFLVVLLYKFFLPIGSSFELNKTFISYILENRVYYLFLPFLIQKAALLFVGFNILTNKTDIKVKHKKDELLNILISLTLTVVLIITIEIF